MFATGVCISLQLGKSFGNRFIRAKRCVYTRIISVNAMHKR